MAEYKEEEFLPLSGIQHFCFCRRQWALIHIEQQWQENLLTAQGRLLHEKAHEGLREKRGDMLIVRALPVFSATLGIRGVCDVVELHRSADGVPLAGHSGTFLPVPVEYKRGSPKKDEIDAVQLCAQAICLEEMLCCTIKQGFLFYGETRRRSPVAFDASLRENVRALLLEMHELYRRRHTPKVKPSKACKACSLYDLCMPKLSQKNSVQAYINDQLKEEEPCESC
ncbi:MAG: CRISPR-associated protein Cas4 [Christensenellales bacterium]|jgi:CRISPR-associated exonuclease Cas4